MPPLCRNVNDPVVGRVLLKNRLRATRLHSRYRLACTPEANAQKGYRRIGINVLMKDMAARGRDGFSPKSKPEPLPTRYDKIASWINPRKSLKSSAG